MTCKFLGLDLSYICINFHSRLTRYLTSSFDVVHADLNCVGCQNVSLTPMFPTPSIGHVLTVFKPSIYSELRQLFHTEADRVDSQCTRS